MTAAAYRVDDLIVDIARAQVTRHGVDLRLPRLSFDFLVALVQAAPRVASLDELMDRVWVGVVVSPETVSQRAKLLRDALGDDSRSPRYFTSVRGRGYRLIASVTPQVQPEESTQPLPGAAVPATDAARPGSPARVPIALAKRSARRIPFAFTVAFIVVALLGIWLAATRHDQEATNGASTNVAAQAADRSIAVLQFKSLGKAAESEVLAFGIAEAVLHQLANLQGLVVIARTSSFALGDEPGDARAIGRRLNVRYMLEGSVQQEGDLLRVTAQLIDTATGTHVWSIRFDKPVSDIFAVQDEIAAQVASALQLSVQADAAARIAGQGTTSLEAYLAYLQGRSLLATGRVGDAWQAIGKFQQSLQRDPAFAAAYVSLAEAEVFAAEFGTVEGRAERFERASQRALGSIEKALALDPRFGPAYRMRGYLEAFSDLGRAEASYRRGLQLRPNDARGYAGLAAVLFEQPAKREEALRTLDRARRIDPLEPAHDVTKSVFLLYDRGDVSGADSLLRNVLQRQPLYLPAIVRLGELAWCCGGDAAGAIELLERAVALDPNALWPRRPLVRAYLDAADLRAAEAVIAESRDAQAVLRLPVLAFKGDWLQAGEASYAALEAGLVAPIDEVVAVVSIRRHARQTGQYARAAATLEALSGITWQADGLPRVPQRPGLRVASIGLADMLQAGGQSARAQVLLDALITQMGQELREPGRDATWYWQGMSIALALRGQPDRAMAWLRRGAEVHALAHDFTVMLGADPAFDAMRLDPDFEALEQGAREAITHEARELARLRAAGQVPRRD